MLLSLQHVDVYFGKIPILLDINGEIQDKARIGLVGPNGAGKTTLLNTMLGLIEPEKGTVAAKPHLKTGYLRQNSGLSGKNTIYDEMLLPFSPLLRTKERMDALSLQLASPSLGKEETKALTEELSRLQIAFEAGDGYMIDVKIKTVLNGMGFQDKDHSTVIDTLSGGEKTRLALAKLLLSEPELLILDEPTNHLDFKTLTWLEEYLLSYKGAVITVSHDRYFLDQVATEIWEIEFNRMRTFRGNYSKYKQLKQELMARWEKEYDAQQEEIADLKDYIARNLVRATTAKSAQSRVKKLQRMEVIDRPREYAKKMALRFDFDRDPVKEVLNAEDLSLTVGEGPQKKHLFDHLSLSVRKGDKIAIIGENGVGKSSLLKALLGEIPFCGGKYRWGKEVKIAYFDQENKRLPPYSSALDALWNKNKSRTELEIRSMLGKVLLSGEDVYKPVSILSGGEKAKLSFAILMMERGNVLVLDEPTNHLDLPSKETLEEALMEFSGTLLFVSHDRYLLSRVPQKIIELYPDHVHVYPGNYEAYLKAKENEKPLLEKKEPKKEPKNSGGRKSKEQKAREAEARAKKKALEDEIAALEEKIASMEDDLLHPERFEGNYQAMDDHCIRLEEEKTKLSQLEEAWFMMLEEEEE